MTCYGIVLALLITGCGSSKAVNQPTEPLNGAATSTVDEPEIPPDGTSIPTVSTAPLPPLPPDLVPRHAVTLVTGITGPDTQEITAWVPEGDRQWPIVLLLHGWGARGIHYTATAELLAGQGVLVFAPDYRSTDIATANWRNPYRDVECAYRHTRAIAGDYQGDLGRPITVVGHSIGASIAMSIVLDEISYGPTGPFDACPGDVPRPERLVALSGCYYRGLEGQALPFTPSEWAWTHHDAQITIAGGADDRVCEVWQSHDAAAELAVSGYQAVEVEIIDHADHFSVIFTRYTNGPWYGPNVEWHALPNDPGGVAAVRIMLDAVGLNPE